MRKELKRKLPIKLLHHKRNFILYSINISQFKGVINILFEQFDVEVLVPVGTASIFLCGYTPQGRLYIQRSNAII